MIQRYLLQVFVGYIRMLIVNGEPLGAVNRRPKEGDFRSNLALGGNAEATNHSIR